MKEQAFEEFVLQDQPGTYGSKPARSYNGSLASLLKGLPLQIVKKIKKTKQTRGAQPYDRVLYQNRVNRNGIAVVPYGFRDKLIAGGFENKHVFMVRPHEYFVSAGKVDPQFDQSVKIGINAFVYYDSRKAYKELPPLANWKPRQRDGPGEVVYRIPATTNNDKAKAKKKVEGDPQGIRFFEYASEDEMTKCCIQLAMLAWHTDGIQSVRTDQGSKEIPEVLQKAAQNMKLWDVKRLEQAGVFAHGKAICPLCRKPIEAKELMSAVEQVEGREVVDLTITEVNLFHMLDLRPGEYNHRHFALGWGHFHCNAVARDHGIEKTLDWMAKVLRRNGYAVEMSDAVERKINAVETAAGDNPGR